MAFVPRQLPEEEENQFGRTDLTTPNPIAQGGGSAGTGQGGTAPGVGTPTQFGSNAAKLTDYLNANKEQVGQFGQEIAGKLGEQYGTAKSAIDQGFPQYNQAVNQGYAQYDPNLVNEAVSNPTGFVQDQDKLGKFQSLYNNQYSGPQNVESWEPYQNINKTVNSAVQNAGLTSNFGGLSSYLNNFMGAGRNTPGMNTLDTALLTRSPEARETIKGAAAPFGGLTEYLGGKVGEGNVAAQTAREQATQGRDQARGALGNATSSFQTDLNNRLQQQRSTSSQSADEAIRRYQDGTATPEQLQLLGFNMSDMGDASLSNEWKNAQILQNDYSVPTDFSSIFTKQSPDVIYQSPGSIASPEEISKSQALSKLSGQDMSQWLGSTAPAGRMIDTNKQALGALGTNISDRDANKLLDYATMFGWDGTPGAETPTVGQFSQFLHDHPENMAVIYKGAQTKGDTTTMNALKRAGYDPNQTGTGGADRTRIDPETNQFQWKDNDGNWVEAPAEYRGSGDSRERFDYNTGQYVPASTDEGTVHTFNSGGGNGIV